MMSNGEFILMAIILGIVFRIVYPLVAKALGEFGCLLDNRRRQDMIRWATDHFGEEGCKRWMRNMEMNAFIFQIGRPPKKWIAKLGPLRLTPDGGCAGFVRMPWGDKINSAGWDFHYNKINNNKTPAPNPYIFYGECGRWHGEPDGFDWLAAGFWSPVEIEGRVVDPRIAIEKTFENDYRRHGYCMPSWFSSTDPEFCKKINEIMDGMMARVNADWKTRHIPNPMYRRGAV